MSAIVDFCYYQSVYMGTEADAASFPALNAHASRVIGAMTRWQVTSENLNDLPSLVQTLYKQTNENIQSEPNKQKDTIRVCAPVWQMSLIPAPEKDRF